MSALARIGAGLDALIGVFSPQAAGRRMLAREAIRSAAGYKAARRRGAGGGWRVIGGEDVNETVRAAAGAIRSQVRDLTRNFPYFAKAVQNLVDFTVGGDGMRLMSQAQDGSGAMDTSARRQIEACWEEWCDRASVCGTMHFAELQQMADRQLSECGEYLFVRRRADSGGPGIPYRLQPVEPDRLCSVGVNPPRGNAVHEGIEYEESTGRRVAYWFMDNTLRRRLVRVDAADVIHGYHARRPGQLRGISDFTPGILIAEDLSDLVESELECARLASRWLAFVTTPNMTGFQQDRIRRDDEGRRLEEVDGATIEYLRPGEEIKFNTGTRPGSTFEPFVQLLLRMIAVSVNVPYELLASDYRGLNFSNQKGVRSDWLKYLRPRQQRHCRWLLDPVFRDVLLQYALLQPRRLPVNMMSNMAAYMRHTWLPTGMESTDPLRETKANAEMVASGVMSPQEWCRSRGRDYEDVLREVADFQQLCTELGVSINNVSTALANNPAANGAPEDK